MGVRERHVTQVELDATTAGVTYVLQDRLQQGACSAVQLSCHSEQASGRGPLDSDGHAPAAAALRIVGSGLAPAPQVRPSSTKRTRRLETHALGTGLRQWWGVHTGTLGLAGRASDA